jgi:hypothetical protein
MDFSSLGISPSLLQALADQNYTQPYSIQKEVITAILNGKDVLETAPISQELYRRPEGKCNLGWKNKINMNYFKTEIINL